VRQGSEIAGRLKVRYDGLTAILDMPGKVDRELKETIPRQLEQRGYRAGVVSIDHLRDLGKEIRDGYSRGLLDEDLYRSYLTGFDSGPPVELMDARSLLVVTYADPPVRFTFDWRGRAVQLIAPPTYLNAEAKDAKAEAILKQLLEPEGYRVARTAAPKKLLAVRSGLARYGRNNITYVEGLGSYHRLVVFCSDWSCRGDQWMEPRMLERCRSCRVCQRGCPTGAVGSDRFLLHAERCLTFWNEKPSDIAFPDWIEDSWHRCLVGCMECQRLCPENKDLQDWYAEGAEFSEWETELLLGGAHPSQLPPSLAEKLQHWDLLELYDQLPRNLMALLASQSCLPRDS
jgi:epoxyqueuosine reductase